MPGSRNKQYKNFSLNYHAHALLIPLTRHLRDKNVTCGTIFLKKLKTSHVGHFHLFPNVPEQRIKQYK